MSTCADGAHAASRATPSETGVEEPVSTDAHAEAIDMAEAVVRSAEEHM